MIPPSDPRWKTATSPQAMTGALLKTHDVVEQAFDRLSYMSSRLHESGDMFEDPAKAKKLAEKMRQAGSTLSGLMTEIHTLSREVAEPERDSEVIDYPESAERGHP